MDLLAHFIVIERRRSSHRNGVVDNDFDTDNDSAIGRKTASSAAHNVTVRTDLGAAQALISSLREIRLPHKVHAEALGFRLHRR